MLLRFAKMPAMKLSDYLETQGRGAKSRLAAQVGGYASDVSDWLAGNRPVPVHRCTAIERATGGAVTRRDLRPDDWAQIWPELAQGQQVQAVAAIKNEAINSGQGV